ncbi:hypothetical protein [Leptospira paudalimensis]|uniref:BsuBI/PstI restriction endonuclease HTH domain-containing protein n=1 Tax=Leptospira paudalimensis TaxID=2950024 RepID=A0ABT3MDQ3_9LEPT|nr:hypothetical protein [Leptospira paudalimensis]MCW7506132.1 hypothetical protein [Leptospira paudalimensis]
MDLDEKMRQCKQILKDLQYPDSLIDDKASFLFLALTDQKIETDWRESQITQSKSVNDLFNYIEMVYKIDYHHMKENLKKVKLYPLLDFGIAKNIVFEIEPLVERPMFLQLRVEAFDVVKQFGTNGHSTYLKVFLENQPVLMKEFKDTLEKYLQMKKDGIIN